jgi:uncharacterized protein
VEAAGLQMRIAVVGAGVAGISAAYLLSQQHEVHLFERESTLGGHTNTRTIETGPDTGAAIDTGFIVCNPRTYPNFYRLMGKLGVRLIDSNMSFSFRDSESGFSYVGPGFQEFISRPSQFLQRRFLKFLWERRRFHQQVLFDLQREAVPNEPLVEYVERIGVSRFFYDNYITPMVASIWSSPAVDTDRFPVRTFAVFFKNHGMLELHTRPIWQTVEGGSHTYLKAFQREFRGVIHLSTPLVRIERNADGVRCIADDSAHHFDKVVLATHADQALRLLSAPTLDERRLLGTWKYHRNRAVLHTDRGVLGGKPFEWAAWNYRRDWPPQEASGPSITYYMNRLQKLNTHNHYFVTLNPPSEISRSQIIYDTVYEHPAYTPDAVNAQSEIRRINGRSNTYFCGAYMGYGFHEDGVTSAVHMAEQFGIQL